MNAVGPGAIDLRGVKRDPASRRIVAEWRRLAGGPAPGKPGRTLIACSGGADSTALLLALAASEPERVAVAHIVHDMRPLPETEADRDFVQGLASRLGRPYLEGRAAVAGVPGNPEAAARRLRYAELARLAGGAGAAFVATAHQADDQLESLVMALLRGAGPRGMRGIASRRPIGRGGAAAGAVAGGAGPAEEEIAAAPGGGGAPVMLIRPMLGVMRADAERICRLAGVEWREDRTNVDVSRLRAAVRRDVLPMLRRLRPRASERASSTARLMRQAQQVIDLETAELMHAASVAPEAVSWPRRAIGGVPELLAGEALRTAAAHLHGVRGRDQLTSRALLPVVRAIRDDSTEPRRFELAGMTVAVTAHTVTASKVEKEHRGA